MKRGVLLACLIGASAFTVSGCVAAVAASAVGAAARSARGEPQGNEHLQPAARKACESHASQYGAVHIIDVEQRTASKIIVWGTVADARQRRSFECSFGRQITNFKLRPIRPSS